MPYGTNRTDWTEEERLAVLHAYGILDTPAERTFDDIAALAAEICNAPIALVSLVDDDRQWFKARVGLDASQTSREVSFCAHAMREPDTMVVPDATLDPRFRENPLVTDEPRIRFYAGALLRPKEGVPLGSLCVIDTRPRPDGLTDLQQRSLERLARQVVSLLELRRAVREREASLLAQADSEARFRVLADSMPQMVWSASPDGLHDYFNARWYEFTGAAAGATDGEAWNDMFHPDDRDRAWTLWRHSLETGLPYEIEYRLRHHSGVYRWTLGRATPLRTASGEIIRWFGTCTDIDDLKRLEQGKDVLSHELSHRIKNIFAVVSALAALSARQHPEAREYAAGLRTRIAALAQAHEFVRPHAGGAEQVIGQMTLHAFLEALFRPYVSNDGRPRIQLEGDDAVFDDQAATSVALLFHELATNAAKYGALSEPDGLVSVETRRAGDRFVLTWHETGGPSILHVPVRTGFGSSLAMLSVEGQLGGLLTQDWRPEGLVVTADLPGTALSRRAAARDAA